MASIGTESGGRRRILFVARDGSRKTIRLGKVSERQALSFKVKVESLVAAQYTGMDEETARWLRSLGDTMHERVAATGLVDSRARQQMKLGDFLEEFFSSVPVKPGTRTTYLQTKRSLIAYFTEGKALQAITPADADRWRDWLRDHEGLAQATVSKRIKTARQAFKRAVRWKLIGENPFEDVVAGSQSNKARQRFIPADVAQRVLDHCPDAEWRLLFALSRYGGLRCPSEHLALKWSDVDWERNRLRIPSTKTENLDGSGDRVMPIFPELYPYLQTAFDKAPEGSEYVISRYRDTAVNLRTQLTRIITRAKVEVWPKLWHNLRATRQTELAAVYPIHLVCSWLGNSPAVAEAHYLQATDADYRMAAQRVTSAAQNPAQSVHVSPSHTVSEQKRPDSQGDMAQGVTTSDGKLRDILMTPTGFEPVLPA